MALAVPCLPVCGGRQPVQVWFDGLPDDDKYEIIDLLEYVEKMTDKPWPEAVFDPLKDAGGISEIKVPNIRCFRDGKYKQITYRMYGFFGPKGHEHAYTFLHCAEKDVKNDTIGKQIAKGQLDKIERGSAGVCKFKLKERPDSEIK